MPLQTQFPTTFVTRNSSQPISYLLRDLFNDTLAAGAVNGSAATPGPGKRIATDTESKLSVGSGMLNFAGGKASPAWGDPGLWYEDDAGAAFSRTAGRLLTFAIIPNDTTGAMMIGWSTAKSSFPSEHAVQFTGATITMTVSGGSRVQTINNVGNTRYRGAIALRAVGAFYFLEIGAKLQLIYVDDIKSTALLYPAIVTNNRAFSADDVVIVDTLYVPVVIASDAFTRADGALDSTDGAGIAETGGSGVAWSNPVGTIAVTGNKAQASAVTSGAAVATVPSATADVWAQAALVRGTTGGGPLVRYVDADNYIYATHNGTNALLIKRVGGSESNVISAAAAYSAGAAPVIVCSGTSFWLLYNGQQVGLVQTISDAVFTGSTTHGICLSDTDSTLDRFVLLPRGTGGEY